MKLGYVPALDGIRGLAVAAVLADHLFGRPAGGRGVDVFFVLSGFLITTLLLEEQGATGRLRLRSFYVRRGRRLLPALGAVLLAYLIVGELIRGIDAPGQVARYGLYVGNVYIAYFVTPGPGWNVGLSHLWSLAQEEQFYVLWPLVVVGLARSRRALLWVSGLAILLICYRAGLEVSGATAQRLYYSPDTHSDGLVIGAALALYRERKRPRVPSWIGVLGLSILGLSMLFNLPPRQFYVWQLAVVNVAAAALVAAALRPSRLTSALCSWTLTWLGKLSYSLYLWHVPVIWLLGRGQRIPEELALSLALAWISYRYIELPFRRRRQGVEVKLPAGATSASITAQIP